MRALEKDDSLAEAHNSMAWAKLVFDWDWARAESEFKRALDLNPGYSVAHQWYAECLVGMGRYEEASAEARRAQELDPLSLTINVVVGWISYYNRQNVQAIAQFRKTIGLDANYWVAHLALGRAYEGESMFAEALAEMKTASSLSGGSPLALAGLGHIYALSRQRDEAEAVHAQLKQLSEKRYVSPLSFATVYAGLGEVDEAFRWLERAHEERSGWLIWLKPEPMSDPLRSDPRFADLLRRMNLQP
jgi:tetratricopeptide (TPR) repeat protein